MEIPETTLEKTLTMRLHFVLHRFLLLRDEYRANIRGVRTRKYYEHFAERLEEEFRKLNTELSKIKYQNVE